MCKLIAITNMPTGVKHQRINTLLVTASKLLAASQKDGFGLSVVSNDGSVYRERHVDPDTFSGVGSSLWSTAHLPKGVRTKVKQGVDFDCHGDFPDLSNARSIIMHGRTATAPGGINNTHPFIKHDERLGGNWVIAHNGVVEWEGKTALPLDTTCDSEHLLNCYAFLDGEDSFADNVSGYAAIVGFNPKGELFCFRDSTAPLYITYHTKTHLTILATDPNHAEELMEMYCKYTKAKVAYATEPVKLDDWSAHLWNLATGEVESKSVKQFGRGYGKISSSSVSRSMGYKSSYDSYGSSYGYGSYDPYGSSSTYNKTTTPAPITCNTSSTTPCKPKAVTTDNSSQTTVWRLGDIDQAILNIESNKESYDDETIKYIENVKRRRKALAIRWEREKRSKDSFLTEADQTFVFGKSVDGVGMLTAGNNVVDFDELDEAAWQAMQDEMIDGSNA